MSVVANALEATFAVELLGARYGIELLCPRMFETSGLKSQ